MSYQLGLAIGGGAARGFYHIGVIQALREAGIEADCIAGTSVGSIIAAFYASGVPLEELIEAAKAVQWGTDVFDWRHTSMGLAISLRNHLSRNGRKHAPGFLEASKLADFINRLIRGRTFSTVKPLVLTSTDITTGEKLLFAAPEIARTLAARTGISLVKPEAPSWEANYVPREVVVPFEDIGLAARASCCFPGVISSVSIDCPDLGGGSTRRLLNDGGVCEQVPVKPLRALGCRKVLGIHLGYVPIKPTVDHFLQANLNAVQFIARTMIVESLRMADHVIYDPRIEDTSMVRLDFSLVQMGYEYARAEMPRILAALGLDEPVRPAVAG
jgi:NTE family protein